MNVGVLTVGPGTDRTLKVYPVDVPHTLSIQPVREDQTLLYVGLVYGPYLGLDALATFEVIE